MMIERQRAGQLLTLCC